MFSRFFGGGKDTQPKALGYNRGTTAGEGSSVTELASPVAATSIGANEENSFDERKNDSPDPQGMLQKLSLSEGTPAPDSAELPPESARSDASRVSRKSNRTSISNTSKSSRSRKGKSGAKAQLSSLAVRADTIEEEEGDEGMFIGLPKASENGPQLKGLSMPEQRKVIDIWHLKNMPRKDFWELRRKLYADVPLGPIKRPAVEADASHEGAEEKSATGLESMSFSVSSTTTIPQSVSESTPKMTPAKSRAERLREYAATHSAAEVALLQMQLQLQSSIKKETGKLMVVDPVTGKKVMPIPRPSGLPLQGR